MCGAGVGGFGVVGWGWSPSQVSTCNLKFSLKILCPHSEHSKSSTASGRTGATFTFARIGTFWTACDTTEEGAGLGTTKDGAWVWVRAWG